MKLPITEAEYHEWRELLLDGCDALNHFEEFCMHMCRFPDEPRYFRAHLVMARHEAQQASMRPGAFS